MTAGQFVVTIDAMTYGGRGICRRGDGKVVFVPLVIPGERVRVSIFREHRGYIEARMEELLEPSPWRITPPCPSFGECGGCDWQHIAYSRQVHLKHRIMEEQIHGKGIVAARMEDPVPSADEFGYRCHATLRCFRGKVLGFFRKRTNTVVPVGRCLVLNRRAQDVLKNMGAMLGERPLPGLEAVEVHAPSYDVIARLFLRRTSRREILDRIQSMWSGLELKGLSCVFLDGREYVAGDPLCPYGMNLHGRELSFASTFGGFIQANPGMNRALVAGVLAGTAGSKTVLDLYGGAGNFGIPLSLQADEVMVVEQDAGLVETGRILARDNGCSGIDFVQGDVVGVLERLLKEGRFFDAVVLDPPREGAIEAVRLLCRMRAQRIVYISCNPSTLARDLAVLVGKGFSVTSTGIFDMFPQTYHIESVTTLRR